MRDRPTPDVLSEGKDPETGKRLPDVPRSVWCHPGVCRDFLAYLRRHGYLAEVEATT